MKHWITLLLAGVSLALAGCATTIRSEVTAFQEWPADAAGESFAFAPTAAQENDLEYRRYQGLVREQLLRLGLTDAGETRKPQLKVTLDYGIEGRTVRVTEPVMLDPGWYGPPPFYDPYFGRPWHYGFPGPFYDPFWFPPPVVVPREVEYELFTRRLHIGIARAADGRMLYQVTVKSEGRIGSLTTVMPVLIRAAFADFPGPNGTTRQIDLPLP